ncbi:MAG: LrgB family protein, partial [Spirochaetaceae bacterium]|nr:LrgB family protein [Spirochaetaceae bacterium]
TKKYAESTKIISYLLTPVTVCLAIPLYEQLQKLKDNWIAIVGGIVSGVITCLLMVLAGSIAFNLDHKQFVSMLPKSITTPIGIALSEQYGGVAGITVGAIVITGIVGNVCAESVLKLFHITEPVAKGVAIGTASHALGTTKAIQMGEVEGAMSGLSIAVAGLLTVVFASFFTMLY